MEKSILLSIKPKYCELIANGNKTIEVRKTKPKLDTPFKCYIYCTKNFYKKGDGYFQGKYCGKIIREFICDEIIIDRTFGHDDVFNTLSCMSVDEIASYCIFNEMYGWHISNLIIYDKPRELSEFQKPCNHYEDCFTCKRFDNVKYDCISVISRPPQNWCYVESKG